MKRHPDGSIKHSSNVLLAFSYLAVRFGTLCLKQHACYCGRHPMPPFGEGRFISASVKAWSRPQRAHENGERWSHWMVRICGSQRLGKENINALAGIRINWRKANSWGIHNIPIPRMLLTSGVTPQTPLGSAACYLDGAAIRMESDLGRTNKHNKYICFSSTNEVVESWQFYLRRWG